MTITLSPETEADIRELACLWGFDVGDEYVLESVARGVLKDGLREFIKARRKRNAEQAIPQVVPDARVFEEKETQPQHPTAMGWGPWYHQANRKREEGGADAMLEQRAVKPEGNP